MQVIVRVPNITTSPLAPQRKEFEALWLNIELYTLGYAVLRIY